MTSHLYGAPTKCPRSCGNYARDKFRPGENSASLSCRFDRLNFDKFCMLGFCHPKMDDKNVISSSRHFFSYVSRSNISRFLPFCLALRRKKEIGEIQKTDSVQLITRAIGLDASRKVSDYVVPRARARETRGRRWMYLPCATAPRNSDKFVVPSCCGQHRPARIYEVRRFNGDAPLQAR